MSTPSYRELTVNGLWKNNPALVQLLCVHPMVVPPRSWGHLSIMFAQQAVLTVSSSHRSPSTALCKTVVRSAVLAERLLST